MYKKVGQDGTFAPLQYVKNYNEQKHQKKISDA